MSGMSGAGVDHILKSSRSAIIGLLKENGVMSVEQLADSVLVLADGELKFFGSLSEWRDKA